MEIGTVRQVDIDHEMQGAYLDYAMSVIVARALPDVRDGLKPVHRRILYAMHDMGMASDKPYKKSARIVGEVLGKYHPHGDTAVYDAMARMAQDFSLRYMLVDGQGNFGSIDGDSPAAMRYTEARLAPIAEQMLADIDKNTIQFAPNFDNTLTEPSVLPALVPNLLVNGASGIAVGMTTNVPPHNLGEVCDALVYLIDHYDHLDDVTLEDVTRFIQGPDFPTGGIVYRYGDVEGNGDRTDLIRNAYALGRGHMTIQAQVHIEEMSRSRSRILVTELPYQVSKSRLIERIADLVRDGRIDGIADLRDESDRQGMRICIELTRTVEARDVLSQLFKLTPMQTTFGLRMLALVDGEPRLLPLKRVLIHYLDHRQEIITRRSRFLLEKAKLRAHILEGLLKALDNIDEVVSIIRRSQTTETARKSLMERLKLTEIQVDAILEMPLKRLVALERRKIADEYKEKQAEIKYLQDLLKSPAKIRAAIREELSALKAKYGDARRTRIVDREKGHHTARDLVEAQDVVVTLWQDGQVSRTASAPRVSSKAAPVEQVWGDTRDDVAFFAASGQAVLVPMHQLPDDQNTPVSNLTSLNSVEQVVAMAVLPHHEPDKQAQETYLTFVSRLGRIKRVIREDFASAASRGAIAAITLDGEDRLIGAMVTTGKDEVLLVTRQGQAIRFAEEEVRSMGLAAAGVLAVKLAEGDAVAGVGLARDDAYVVTCTEAGFAKRTPVLAFPTQKRYGGGVQAAKLTAKTGPVAVAAVAGLDQDVVLTTAKGHVTRLAAKEIQVATRATAGYKTPQDSSEPYLDLAKHGPPVLLAVLPGTKVGATRARGDAPEPASPGSEAAQPAARRRPASKPDETSAPTMEPAQTTLGTGNQKSRKQGSAAATGKPAPATSRTRKAQDEQTGKPPGARAGKPALAARRTKDEPAKKPAKPAGAKAGKRAATMARTKGEPAQQVEISASSGTGKPASGVKSAPASRSRATKGESVATGDQAAQIPLPLESTPDKLGRKAPTGGHKPVSSRSKERSKSGS